MECHPLADGPKPNGEPTKIKTEPIEVVKSSEPWSSYELKDGTILKMKVVLVDINRVIGQYDDAGNPVYQFQSTQIVNVSAPDKLKRKK